MILIPSLSEKEREIGWMRMGIDVLKNSLII
jgi:hypothetical protein